jgi:hypothetical protein
LDDAVLNDQILASDIEHLSRPGQQKNSRRRRGMTERDCRHLDRLTSDCGALVRRICCVPKHDRDAVDRYIQFLGNNLCERRANAGAEIHTPAEAYNRAVGTAGEKEFDFLALGLNCRLQRSRSISRGTGLIGANDCERAALP